ncbi:MORN repeat-containing protein 1 isoform X2 [Xenopus laevis]|uniref:MORN repeat-containing protein 1 isoform X2 n=1 Tax=Xenopus laevis TaxID=8355 RepID=A0A8J1L6X2_XENLA|nr:MORN repeat-containing protein 1 isoform X2 [Xenopus laevis]
MGPAFQITGYGLYVYANSFFRYEGQWKSGKKHGHGKLLFKDGSFYEGEFVDGEITGNGLRYWASSGNKYSGEFQAGELHGYGVMQYKDGGRYEGEFVFGIREGHGLLVDKEGKTYSGAFHNNKKYGAGQMKFMNGDNYEGDWILDQRQGHGVLHCADGSIYEGQWRNDVFNGQGIMIHCSGVIYDGLWINGHPAVAAKKMVILGEDIINFIQGSPSTVHIQLQTEEGETVNNENGRVLKISAGIKYLQPIRSQTPSFLELIEDLEEKPFQTPFGYECINYPLTQTVSRNQDQKDTVPFNSQSRSVSCGISLLSKDSISEHGSVASQETESALNSFGESEYPEISVTTDEMYLPPSNVRVEAGCAVFKDIMPGPPPSKVQHLLSINETDKNKGKKPSKISAEKMTVSQEKIEDSRSETIMKERKVKKENQLQDSNLVRPGEYIIIMVEDVTVPPFLGYTLPPVFKLTRVLLEKPKGKTSRKETLKIASM